MNTMAAERVTDRRQTPEPTVSGARRKALMEQFRKAKPAICMERTLAFTNSHKQTEGQPVILRRAKAFRAVCESITVRIFDHELVVGTLGNGHRLGVLCPEMSWSWLKEEIDTITSRKAEPYQFTDENKKLFVEEIVPYWRGQSLEEFCLERMPEDHKNIGIGTGIMDTEMKWRSGVGEITPDHQDILFVKGYSGIKNEALDQLRQLDNLSRENQEKRDFYRSMIEIAEAMITLGKRYSTLAESLAENCSDPVRKKELLTIARTCSNVPANAPASFIEGLQMVFFVQLGCLLAESSPAFNVGRFDQFMFPLYQADIEAGRLDRAEALEQIECLWIKLSEIFWLLTENGAKYYAGYCGFQNLTLGGRKRNGRDATNEVSYLALEATANVGLHQPSVSVSIHPETPDEFLIEVCRLARRGNGMPAIHNDIIATQMMMYKGLPPDQARDWNGLGCVVPSTRKVSEWTYAGQYNMAACLEWALNRGKSRKTGQQFGLETKDPATFTSFDDLLESFYGQVKKLIKTGYETTIIQQLVHQESVPRPFFSAMVEGCMESGKDLTRGGAKYNAGPGWVVVGCADTANGLAAIKKIVFDQKKTTMAELCSALDNNFEGFEELRQLLVNSPKFGNDDDYVDNLQVELADFSDREFRQYRDVLGLPFHSAIMGLTFNIPTGNSLGALPCGRFAGVPLAEGSSPHPGTDISGPTACIKSLGKMNHENQPGGTLLNLKFLPKAVEGERGLYGLSALIRAYFELGGYHVQFNVVDARKLLDAQLHPEKYGSFVVRVAGYCAIFTECTKEVQNEIIRRTEHCAL
ncbi:glycyl radical protein [Desulforhopalus singaporensis]|uniref:Formate C-acetyltransferase n=1 Tax=Desulforhopalus singaporensis TaxID=91360 RepID=A0A1H0KFR3_9BACT|nr:pyruvate formate lyase family protein [Desulforhopalus singaporensis]SDO54784.1 formate C-acetyltransferase [Desulforhopalus singaporensis]